ncbi:hypothetical protein ACRE1U_00545 [Helicobacter himalayensis]|uniref:hypothetical protein n=1 Tax=Helicobacter himalayensis TaxID=1591088 RepID=UPI003D6E68FD
MSFSGQYYLYEEPRVMDISGVFGGIGGEYKYFDADGFFGEAHHQVNFAHFSTSSTRYNGSQCTISAPVVCTPLHADSKDSYTFFEYHYKPLFIRTGNAFASFDIGLGYRFLSNQISATSAYKREQSYLYLISGFNAQYALHSDVKLFANVLYKSLRSGKNTSYLKDLGFDSNLNVSQHSGFGLEFNLGVERELSKYGIDMGVGVSAYFEYWSIGESNTQALHQAGVPFYFKEPYNYTQAFGLRILLSYSWL